MASNKNISKIDSLYQNAEKCESSGDYKGAAKYYTEALALRQNIGTWGVLGWIHLKNGDFKEALNAAKKMRSLSIKQTSLKRPSRTLLGLADCLIGKIHHQAGRKVLAERYYRESLDANPRSETCLLLAALLEENDRSTEAKMCYQRAIEVDPNDKEAHYHLALWYNDNQDYDRSSACLQKAIDIDPGYTEAISELARIKWRFGSAGFKEAVAMLEKAISKDPDNLDSYIFLALSYKLLKKLKDAEQIFRKALEQFPPDDRLCWCFGYFLANDLKNPVEAEKLFAQAIELAPESGAAKYYYGQFLLDRQEEAGKKLFEDALKLGFKKAGILLTQLQQVEMQS